MNLAVCLGAPFHTSSVNSSPLPIPPYERNRNLPRLIENELPGIFNYLLDGYARLMDSGRFTLPERSLKWRDQYRHENDIEAMYAADGLDFNPAFTLSGQDLYDDYRDYCEQNGYKPQNAANAAKEWRRLGLTDSRTPKGTTWKGSRLLA